MKEILNTASRIILVSRCCGGGGGGGEGVKCITLVMLHESKLALFNKGIKAGPDLKVAQKKADLQIQSQSKSPDGDLLAAALNSMLANGSMGS